MSHFHVSVLCKRRLLFKSVYVACVVKKSLNEMTITCNIIYDNNPNKVFYPGQNVIGHIELNIPETTKVKGG